MLIILSALSYQVMAQAEQAELSEQAEQAEQTDSLDLIQLEEVIVSGTRAGKKPPRYHTLISLIPKLKKTKCCTQYSLHTSNHTFACIFYRRRPWCRKHLIQDSRNRRHSHKCNS